MQSQPDESSDDTQRRMFDISEQDSEESTRIGEKAYKKYYEQYKKINTKLKIDKAKTISSPDNDNNLLEQQIFSDKVITILNRRRESQESITIRQNTHQHKKATKEYLKYMEKIKLPPLPNGVVQRKGEERKIQLSERGIGKYYTKAIGKSLSHLHVESFDAQNNNINMKGLKDLLQCFDKSKEIDLTNNNIQCEGAELLCQQILLQEDCRLEDLDLSDNNLGDKGVSILCKAIATYDTLRILNLGKNNVTDLSVHALAKYIRSSKQLRDLKLHWNNLRGTSLQILLDALQDNKSIKFLDLSWNALGSLPTQKQLSCGKLLGNYLKNNQTLLHLDISFNGLGKQDCILLGDGLRENHTLLGIHIRGNEGEVDTLGFIKKKDSQNPLQNLATYKIINKPSFLKTVETKQNLRMKKVEDQEYKSDRCWYCEGWQETEFTWEEDFYYADQTIEVMIHFDFENFKGHSLTQDQDNPKLHTIWKMLPPGQHYYYFSVNGVIVIKGQDQRVKTQNLNIPNVPDVIEYLNSIMIQKDKPLINQFYKNTLKHCLPRSKGKLTLEMLQQRPRTPWSFEYSIFKEYKADTEDLEKQCFEFDWQCMKKPKISSDQEYNVVKNELYKGYRTFKTIYRYYSALGMQGNIFSIGFNTYTELMKDELALVDGDVIRMPDIDLLFISVNTSRKGELNPSNALVRYQLLEVLLRIAIKKYNPFGLSKTMSEGLRTYNEKHTDVMKAKYQAMSQGWRNERYWNEGCENVYKAFRLLMYEAYITYGGNFIKPGEKVYMTCEEFENFINDTGLCNDLFSQRELATCFNLSMMTQVDELNKDRHLKATYIEYLEAVARVVDKASPFDGETINKNYEDKTPEELMAERIKRPLHVKLVVFMNIILERCVRKVFRDRFEYPLIEDEDKVLFYIK